MLRSALLVASLLRADSLVIGPNDNTRSAGRQSGTSLTLSLDMVLASWSVNGPGRAAGTVLAFAEPGKSPTIPGPMLRVKLGTKVTATIRNRWNKPLVVHGLSTRRVAVMATLAIPAGGQATTTFTADAEGTYFYWAAEPGVDLADREYLDSQLSGAFIVDATDPPPGERVFVLGSWTLAKAPMVPATSLPSS